MELVCEPFPHAQQRRARQRARGELERQLRRLLVRVRVRARARVRVRFRVGVRAKVRVGVRARAKARARDRARVRVSACAARSASRCLLRSSASSAPRCCRGAPMAAASYTRCFSSASPLQRAASAAVATAAFSAAVASPCAPLPFWRSPLASRRRSRASCRSAPWKARASRKPLSCDVSHTWGRRGGRGCVGAEGRGGAVGLRGGRRGGGEIHLDAASGVAGHEQVALLVDHEARDRLSRVVAQVHLGLGLGLG